MAKRAKTKRAKTKTAKKSSNRRSRDRKLVAGRQKHEVRYTAKKARVKARAVKRAVKRVGHSRGKVERVLSGVKKAVKRGAQALKRQALSSTPKSSPAALPQTNRPIREHMEVIGADGVHIGTVDKLEGDRIKLTKKDSGEGSHQGHHHYIPTALVADVEGDQVRLSANADVAVTFLDEADGSSSGQTKIS